MTTTTDHPLERFLPLLVSGDGTASEADLAADALLFDPQAGRVDPTVLPFFLPARYMWLEARKARVEHVRTIRSPARVVVEQLLHLTASDHALALPVALAGETGGDGKLTHVRIYHALHPLTGRKDHRGPLLTADDTLVPAPPVAAYFDALGRGDIAAIRALLAEDDDGDGAARHAQPGGVGYQLCSVTDDGAACALEANLIRWGDRMLPAQASLIVLERASPTTLAAARIYDDGEPPTR